MMPLARSVDRMVRVFLHACDEIARITLGWAGKVESYMTMTPGFALLMACLWRATALWVSHQGHR